MEGILDKINEWLKTLLIDGITGNLSGMFDTVNTKVGEIAGEVGMTPSAWNGSVFSLIRNLSETVIIPIAGIILTFVMCYELIQLVIEKNNLHDMDTWIFFKWIFKTFVAVLLVTNTWNIVMAVFDMAQHVVGQSGGLIVGNTSIDLAAAIPDMEERLKALELGPLLSLWFQSMVVGLMLIIQDQVWGRVTENRIEGKSTRYYIDEFHLLLKEEQTASYSVEIWKRFRKWGGIPTGITQNVKDLLSSREVENIFENSDFVYMLNQAAGDREILSKQLGISPQQLSYVTHSGAGEGLIFYGNVILPFVDRFPQDTELYRIMTTKPEEVSS